MDDDDGDDSRKGAGWVGIGWRSKIVKAQVSAMAGKQTW